MKYHYAPRHTNLSMARNLAVEKTNGEWISFLDCDDYLTNTKLEKQVDIINKKSGEIGLIYGIRKWVIMDSEIGTSFGKKYSKKSMKDNQPEGRIFNKLLMKNFVPLSASLILKKAFIKVGCIDNNLTYAEDYNIFLKISKDYQAAFVNEICSWYRVHDNNLSRSFMHVGYTESMQCVKNYFPNPFAIIGYLSYGAKLIIFRILHLKKRIAE